jgi:MYXO-CTERM domain-containing protein
MRAVHGPLPGYQWVHAFSEIAAATAIGVYCARWWRAHPRTTTAADRPPLAVRAVAFAVVALAATLGAVHGAAAGSVSGAAGEVAFFLTVTGAGSWGGLAVIVLAGAWWVRRRNRE